MHTLHHEDPYDDDDALEQDATFRQEVVENVRIEAEKLGIPIDYRAHRLLERYAEGAITYQELDREVIRMASH